MNKHPIIVLISGNGSNLQAIMDKCENVRIQCVISDQFDAYGLQRAMDAGLDAVWIGQAPGTSRDTYSDELASFISYFNPKLVVLAGFMKILSPRFFQSLPNTKIINIHPSLLPKYKGLNTHERVLEARDEEHGMTIHHVTPELDSGPIIWQSSFFIQPDDTVKSLEEKVHKREHQWYPWVIDQVVRGNI